MEGRTEGRAVRTSAPCDYGAVGPSSSPAPAGGAATEGDAMSTDTLDVRMARLEEAEKARDQRLDRIEHMIDDLRKEINDLRKEINDLRKDIRQLLYFVMGTWITLMAAILLKVH